MAHDRTTAYRVDGMSCSHCEAAIRDEVEDVGGVEAVEVDLGSKQVVVHGDFDDAAVRAAIDDAGYEVAA